MSWLGDDGLNGSADVSTGLSSPFRTIVESSPKEATDGLSRLAAGGGAKGNTPGGLDGLGGRNGIAGPEFGVSARRGNVVNSSTDMAMSGLSRRRLSGALGRLEGIEFVAEDGATEGGGTEGDGLG